MSAGSALPASLAGVLAALLAVIAPAALAAGGDAERGRSIYVRGLTAEDGAILAAFGDEGFEVEASVLPCASCHGADGRGRAEGGISPSDLTWSALTHPRGAGGTGREHPPYDERSLVRAIAMGVDPAGNELSTTMPRYRLSHRDAADLVAYLRQLEARRDPGLSPTELVLGTLVAGAGSTAAAALAAFFDELNAAGGLYGRKVRFETYELPERGASRSKLAAMLRAQWQEAPPFALVAPEADGRMADLAEIFAVEQLPVVGPFARQPRLEMPPDPYVFYLVGGIDSQARALLDWAAESRGEAVPGRLLLLAPAGTSGGRAAGDSWLDSARDQAKLGGWSEVLAPALETLDVATLGDGDTVLFLGGGPELDGFLRRAAAAGRHPQVLIPGAFASASVLSAPPGFAGRLHLAFPVLPSDAEPQRLDEVWKLAAAHELEQRQLASQLAALAAAEVLVEGLSRAGRELSRERLIEALETLYRHPTGLLPAVTYGPNRRLGARGAHIVEADLEQRRFVPVGVRVVPR